MRGRLNRRIRTALQAHCLGKVQQTVEYIDCSIDYLKKWFESQFTDKIGWHNINEWHIDHVKPCSSFDLPDTAQQHECFNWKNLRPCLVSENLMKRDKIDEDLIKAHSHLASEFEKVNPLPSQPGDIVDGAA